MMFNIDDIFGGQIVSTQVSRVGTDYPPMLGRAYYYRARAVHVCGDSS